MDASPWTQVLVRVGDADPALVSDRLWAFAPAAIEERDDGSLLLVAGFDDHDVAASAGAAVEGLGVASVHLRAVDDDGLDAWRAWARIEQAGPFTLVPAWLPVPEPPPQEPGDRVAAAPRSLDRGRGRHLITLDPGRTFGSGSHPTTRLVLSTLARVVNPGDLVLDVGCGSGVLSIGAALLGAGRVLGIDVDPEAPPTTTTNARANGVGSVVSATDEDLSSVSDRGERFDVVAANLLAPVLADLAPDLIRALASDGHLVVSGLLTGRWEATATALEPLVTSEVIHEQGWTAMVLRHP